MRRELSISWNRVIFVRIRMQSLGGRASAAVYLRARLGQYFVCATYVRDENQKNSYVYVKWRS